MSEEKPFSPSRKKLEKAREAGQLIKSKLLSAAVPFAVGLGAVSLIGSAFFEKSKILFEACLGGFSPSASPRSSGSFSGSFPIGWGAGINQGDLDGAILTCVQSSGLTFISASGGCLLVVAAAGVALQFCQLGFRITPRSLSFDISKLNPAAGFTRLFKSLKELLRTCGRIVVAGLILYQILRSQWAGLPAMTQAGGELRLGASFSLLHQTIKWCVGVSLVLACFEYWGERRRFLKEQGMSHQEMRQEYKDDEGDPHIRSSRRRVHEELAMEEISARVRKSKVIIVAKNDDG